MNPEDFKRRINNLFRCNDGKLSEKEVAKHLDVSVQDLRRFKRGKLPPRYKREKIFDRLKRTWIHYEGRNAEQPEINLRQERETND